MLRVALSGGIASGKTLVSDMLAGFGVPIVDTDVIAREVVAPGTNGLHQVAERFGQSILDDSNSLNRRKLRELVFTDVTAKKDLEAILHPLIRKEVRKALTEYEDNGAPYSVTVVPLLIETGQANDYDHVVIVDVEPVEQLARIMARDNSTEEQAKSIIESQATRKERLAAADDLILNISTIKAVELQVKKLHERLLYLAKKKGPES